MPEFDRTALEGLMETADAEGFFEQAQGDWQPSADELLGIVSDAGISARTDEKSKVQYAHLKPVLTIMEGVSEKGEDLSGKEFPLDRFGCPSRPINAASGMAMQKFGRSATVIAGEMVTTFAACVSAFEGAKKAGTLLHLTRSTGVGKKSGKPWASWDIDGIVNIDTPEEPAAAPE